MGSVKKNLGGSTGVSEDYHHRIMDMKYEWFHKKDSVGVPNWSKYIGGDTVEIEEILHKLIWVFPRIEIP